MPLAQSIEVVVDDGSGGTTVTERTIPSTSFAVILDDIAYEPAICRRVEAENGGNDNTTSDQCGNTERNRTGNDGWKVTVSGIITGADRPQNLSLPTLRDVVAGSDSIEISSDVISGTYELSNVLIGQEEDLVSVQTVNTDGKEKAFDFQLQLGETQSE
jgi:hypothetical protein